MTVSSLTGYHSVQPIPRVGKISFQEFETNFYSKEQPVILTDMIGNWPAMSEWTPQALKPIFGDAVLDASVDLPVGGAPGDHNWTGHSKKMRVAEFLDLMTAAERPCYMRQAPSTKLASFEHYFDFGVLFPGMAERDPQSNLWLGSAGTDSGLHWDTAMNFLAQIYGRKELVLFSPRDTGHLYAYPDQIRWSHFNAFEPDFTAHPRARKATAYTGILGAGEVIHIPRTWWHEVRSLDPAISINCFFRPECSLRHFWSAMVKGGLSTMLNVGADFVRLGIFKGSRGNRLFADIPTGLYLYHLCSGYVRRRFSRSAAT
jgi:hypothetical protein